MVNLAKKKVSQNVTDRRRPQPTSARKANKKDKIGLLLEDINKIRFQNELDAISRVYKDQVRDRSDRNKSSTKRKTH